MPPQRKNVERVPTVDVMGTDSYVLVRKITTGEAREIVQFTKARKAELREKAQDARLPADLRAVYLQELQADDTELSIQEALKRYVEHIIEWNWVYEDGTAMPLPSKEPSVLNALTGEELRSLARALGMLTDQNVQDFG